MNYHPPLNPPGPPLIWDEKTDDGCDNDEEASAYPTIHNASSSLTPVHAGTYGVMRSSSSFRLLAFSMVMWVRAAETLHTYCTHWVVYATDGPCLACAYSVTDLSHLCTE